jgi:hypothetical protein
MNSQQAKYVFYTFVCVSLPLCILTVWLITTYSLEVIVTLCVLLPLLILISIFFLSSALSKVYLGAKEKWIQVKRQEVKVSLLELEFQLKRVLTLSRVPEATAMLI